MITDVLIASPIINMEDENVAGVGAGVGAGAGAAVGGGAAVPSQFAEYGGVDPNLDPELAMALRISLEEERARQVQPS
jgi:26S proteasome regulatory subunit N10